MQKSFEEIEAELVKRIYKSFLVKYQGNKSEFARISQCTETTVRRVFRNEQRMTLNLFLRFCTALDIKIEQIFRDIEFPKKSS
ncbi:MAG: helix-turn-helix transcriptional regulator [Weeksellaceae bacterium]|nr:helix-turn-helix transcriptional regulator [Weeksellaceae bacterium]